MRGEIGGGGEVVALKEGRRGANKIYLTGHPSSQATGAYRLGQPCGAHSRASLASHAIVDAAMCLPIDDITCYDTMPT